MKKYILSASIVVLLGLSSCGDVLDIYPVENNTTDQFYSNEYEIQQAVMGVYARLGRNKTNTDFPTDFYYQASESRSDNFILFIVFIFPYFHPFSHPFLLFLKSYERLLLRDEYPTIRSKINAHKTYFFSEM